MAINVKILLVEMIRMHLKVEKKIPGNSFDSIRLKADLEGTDNAQMFRDKSFKNLINFKF